MNETAPQANASRLQKPKVSEVLGPTSTVSCALTLKIPIPNNVIYIDPDVPKSTNVTPAAAPFAEEPTYPAPAMPAGKMGAAETPLPAVNAEASDYYGGNQVHSRARTFSSVCLKRLVEPS